MIARKQPEKPERTRAYRIWDEDPRYVEALYPLLVGSLIVAVIGGFALALYSGDWDNYLTFLRFLAIIPLALCLYAGLVWTVGNVIKLCGRLARRLKRKQSNL